MSTAMKNGIASIDALPRDRLLAEFSLWSASLGRMAEDIARVDPHVDIYHADVSDGHFSPALLLFPDLLAQVRKAMTKPLHVHLMVSDAILIEQVKQFAEAGADVISVHAEHAHADEALALIAELGCKAGVVLKLETPVSEALRFLPHLSMLTLLGTKIGIKGVGLDDGACGRLTEARQMIRDAGLPQRIILAADGGIREHTVPLLRAAGAETIVMGSLAFNAPDLAARMAWVHAQGK
jgi:ribulose-phosphate 3-epimerase